MVVEERDQAAGGEQVSQGRLLPPFGSGAVMVTREGKRKLTEFINPFVVY